MSKHLHVFAAVLLLSAASGAAEQPAGNWAQWGSPADIQTPFPATLEKIVTVGTEAFGLFTWVDWDVGVTELSSKSLGITENSSPACSRR